MSKRPKHRRPSSRPPRGAAFGIGRNQHSTGEPHLHTEVEGLLLSDSPLDLLAYASTLVASLEDAGPLGRPRGNQPSLTELIAMFRDTGARATDALLLAITALDGDELLSRRISTEVAARRHPLPAWLTQLHQFVPVRAVAFSHLLGDGENIIVGIDSPAGGLSYLFYIDHNQGSAVSDGYPLDTPFAEVTARLAELAKDDRATIMTELSLGDARARIEGAIATGRTMYPPFETDTWPAARPFAEWMLRSMPSGGVGYPDPAELVDALDVPALVRQLVDANNTPGFDAREGSDDRDIAETLFTLAANYFGGDALRWSPTTVEILLCDLVPRKIVAPDSYLSRVPAVMRTVIAFAHALREVPPSLTKETIAAVDVHEPEYRELTRSNENTLDDLIRKAAPDDLDAFYKSLLAEVVGGVDALETLDVDPLPDEALVLDAVDPDIRDRVMTIAAIAGDAADELFGPELRTVVHRVVVRIAASDPTIFRRRAKVETTAAAVLWISANVNSAFDRMTVKAMMEHLGLRGSPSQRAEPMLRALGVDDPSGWSHNALLGDPTLLTSDRRRILADRWAWVTGQTDEPWGP